MHAPFPKDPVTVQNVMEYHNRITDTMKTYLQLPFTPENQCKMQQELRSIVDNAKFDLIPIDALPFPIRIRAGTRIYRIDSDCTVYVESENFDRVT